MGETAPVVAHCRLARRPPPLARRAFQPALEAATVKNRVAVLHYLKLFTKIVLLAVLIPLAVVGMAAAAVQGTNQL